VEHRGAAPQYITLYQDRDVLIQETGLSSLARVDSHPPNKVVQEVTSCRVDDAQGFNCNVFVIVFMSSVCFYYCFSKDECSANKGPLFS